MHANLAIVHAEFGQTDAALAAARRATDLLPISKDMLDGSFYLACRAKVEVRIGETATALEHLERLLAVPAGHEVSVASLRNDPAWDAHADAGTSRGVTADGRLLSMLAELWACRCRLRRHRRRRHASSIPCPGQGGRSIGAAPVASARFSASSADAAALVRSADPGSRRSHRSSPRATAQTRPHTVHTA